jgi:N-acetylneuraminic acid mutarotase
MNGRIYLLGGRGSRAVSVFDPATRKWTKKSSPPMELNHFQPVVWNNKIWIVGAFTGRYPDETSVTHVYSYTPSTDTWRKEHMIPEQRRRGGAGAVLHEGKILLVGGNNKGHRDGAKPWVDLYDPATGEWQVLPDAPSARDHATIAISNGKLVAAAGRKSQYPNVFGNTVASTDVLNLNSGNWTQGAAVPTPRAGTMTVAVGDEVVVIGGETSASTAHKEVQAYNVTTNRWRSLSPLAVGRHSGAAMVLDRQIHVISGSERRGGSPESTVHEVLSFQ